MNHPISPIISGSPRSPYRKALATQPSPSAERGSKRTPTVAKRVIKKELNRTKSTRMRRKIGFNDT